MNNPFDELFHMLFSIKKAFYPEFVSRNGYRMSVPVFVYHQIYHSFFRHQLSYLSKNGYKTFNTDEFYEMIHRPEGDSQKHIMLTFDDGLASLYDIAFPLLKKYGFTAVAFILPHWVGKKGMVTWDQVQEMHGSGVIDFQSHSYHHAAIYCSDEIVDFFKGNILNHQNWYVPWDVPVVKREGKDRLLGNSDIGSPIFKTVSRISDYKRFYPDQDMEFECIETVNRDGHEAFFQSKKWQHTLMGVCQKYMDNGRMLGRFESTSEQKRSILSELVDSKIAIEEMLIGKKIRHFAYPWLCSGRIAQKLLEENGYKSAFGGLFLGGDRYNPYEHIYSLSRVDGDFLLCLPGGRKQTYYHILLYKIMRRLRKGKGYW